MKLALAQVNPTIGDIDGNARLIERFVRAGHDAGADLVVLPELAVCGYPPRDLLLREGFIEACSSAARRIGQSAPEGITVVLGTPLPAPSESGGAATGRITNSLVAWRDGLPIGRYDKRLLPTYDVFDEDRYFTPGSSPCIIDVPALVGGTIRVGLAICEDLWKGDDAGFAWRYQDSSDPVADAARHGARVLAVPSASPFVLGKGARHRDILRSHARRHALTVAAVNQVGGNDDLLFDGHSAVFDPNGRLVAAAPGFAEHLLVTDLAGPPVPAASPIAELPDPLTQAADERLLYEALVTGIRDYCSKTGFASCVIGLSGGIDSALTAVLATRALGAPNVLGIAMPGPYSSDHAIADARSLATSLGIAFETISILDPISGFRSAIDPAFGRLGHEALGRSLPDLSEENLQSRARGTVLMAVSNRTGAMVLTTGNKSELAVGYATLYGDMNGGLAVLSDITKGRVYALSRWINAQHHAAGFASPPIPPSSMQKPPSAELRPNQTDQDTLPAYDVLDAIIERFIERQESPAGIADRTGIDPALVRRITRMIDLAEYKRRQAAVGLKVTSVAFGAGRRQPIAQRWIGP
ncbi:MAG: NAD+ synthase [Phycisphaeraceae bacterium]|nr:NAD+ synthase [Phycisphaerae bacterium]MBX3391783.1 NAD+ synthase [Phycisphaeraceae bacterium]